MEKKQNNGDFEKLVSERDQTTEPSKKSRKFGCLFFLLVGILFLLVAIYLPGSSHYRNYHFNSIAKETLENLAAAQNDYYSKHKIYAKHQKELTNWADKEGVEVAIVRADKDCWVATAKHEKVEATITYDSCRGGLQ